jgi:hypothetical protein
MYTQPENNDKGLRCVTARSQSSESELPLQNILKMILQDQF